MVLQMQEQAHKAQVEAKREREHEHALEEQSRAEKTFSSSRKDAEQGAEETVETAIVHPARRRG